MAPQRAILVAADIPVRGGSGESSKPGRGEDPAAVPVALVEHQVPDPHEVARAHEHVAGGRVPGVPHAASDLVLRASDADPVEDGLLEVHARFLAGHVLENQAQVVERHAGIGVSVVGRGLARRVGQLRALGPLRILPDRERLEIPARLGLHRAVGDLVLVLRDDPRAVAEHVVERDAGLPAVGEREALRQPAAVIELARGSQVERRIGLGHMSGEQHGERLAVRGGVVESLVRASLVVILADDPAVFHHDRGLVGCLEAAHAGGVVLVGERHQVLAQRPELVAIDAEVADARFVGRLAPAALGFRRREVGGERGGGGVARVAEWIRVMRALRIAGQEEQRGRRGERRAPGRGRSGIGGHTGSASTEKWCGRGVVPCRSDSEPAGRSSYLRPGCGSYDADHRIPAEYLSSANPAPHHSVTGLPSRVERRRASSVQLAMDHPYDQGRSTRTSRAQQPRRGSPHGRGRGDHGRRRGSFLAFSWVCDLGRWWQAGSGAIL